MNNEEKPRRNILRQHRSLQFEEIQQNMYVGVIVITVICFKISTIFAKIRNS